MPTEIPPPSKAYRDATKVLERYRTEGVTRDESDEFLQGAIDELESDNTGKYADNVGKVGQWAVEVDEAFDRVTRGLTALVTQIGNQHPQLRTFLNEWNSYNQRWIDHLSLSRDVASEHMSILKRFDQVFIELVMMIQTNQDRLDCIVELEAFASEEHDRSTEMYQGFLTLKRDIDDFVGRFDAWVERTANDLDEQATQLQQQLELLKTAIAEVDEQIAEATRFLLTTASAAEPMVALIGLAISGTILAALAAERIARTVELENVQKELEEVNERQAGMAKIKSEFDDLRPDIYLISNRLLSFAEIWSSIRSQSVQFRETLEGGMDAATNSRFKLELKLARELCTPLVNGLEKYATALANRPSRSA